MQCTYLAHHGTKGQKWGVRRYQNEDGTLTDEGRRRYGYGSESGSLMTKNTSERLAKGAKIGGAIGSVVGLAGGAVGGAALVAMTGPAGPALAMAGYTFAASLLSGTLSGTLYGGVAGGIVGTVETRKGRKYIEKYDTGLEDFEKRDRSK